MQWNDAIITHLHAPQLFFSAFPLPSLSSELWKVAEDDPVTIVSDF